ncbi:hypothetical protein GGR57DRAFT_158739 [Xylariaceae sp. FL1272]|nr:hypothetical protein GGR57DRAFT_158739 [Xylariaceae sp. FL1272]
MDPPSENEINLFFNEKPDKESLEALRRECEWAACDVVGDGTIVDGIEQQGSLSYTVRQFTDTVVLFRRQDNDQCFSKAIGSAKEVHGELVPDYSHCGYVREDEDAIAVYKMPRLSGTSWAELRPSTTIFSLDEWLKCANMYRDLAAYFARLWKYPKNDGSGWDTEIQNDKAETKKRLSILKWCGKYPYLDEFFREAEDSLPFLFGGWPKALAHGDLSWDNIFLNESTFAITGILNWSAASVRPFGTDLQILHSLASLAADGSIFYNEHENLNEVFWEEFWRIAGVREPYQEEIPRLAEIAGKLTFIIDLAFLRENGEIVDRLGPLNDACLERYFGNAESEVDVMQGNGSEPSDAVADIVLDINPARRQATRSKSI